MKNVYGRSLLAITASWMCFSLFDERVQSTHSFYGKSTKKNDDDDTFRIHNSFQSSHHAAVAASDGYDTFKTIETVG